jgi:hypothetical protein
MSGRVLQVEIVGDARSLERTYGRAATSTRSFGREVDKHGRTLQVLGQRASKTEKDIGNLSRGALKATGVFGRFGAALALGSGGFLIGAGISELGKSIVEVTRKAKESEDLLDQTMKNAGLSYRANKGEIDAYLKSQSRLSAFSKGDLRESLTSLVRVTKDLDKAQRLAALAADVARGRHISLQQATLLVIKAQMGQVGALRRMGIEIQPVHTAVNALTDSHKRFTAEQHAAAKAMDLSATKTKALGILQRTYAGDAKKYGESDAAAADKFRNAITQLEVQVGKVLVPTLTRGLTRLAEWLTKMVDSGKATAATQRILETIKGVFNDLKGPVTTAAKALKSVVDAVGGWKRAFELILSGAIALKIAKLGGAIGDLKGGMIAAGRQAVISGQMQEGASRKAAITYATSTSSMKLATIGLAATIKGALISTGIGALIVAAGFAAEYIITHWSKVGAGSRTSATGSPRTPSC